MKRKLLALSLLGLTVFTGCVVMSVYPYYTAKDLVFDPTLLGTWSNQSTNEFWNFTRLNDQAYNLSIIEGDKTNGYVGCLFKLKGQAYLDFCAAKPAEYQLPMHVLLKVVQIEPSFTYQTLNYEWLEELLERNPEAIRHHDYRESGDTNKPMTVLTADTRELQEFIIKHADSTNVFTKVVELKRWSK